MNLDDIMSEFGSSSDKPYDWAKDNSYPNSPEKEEPAAESSLVAVGEKNDGIWQDSDSIRPINGYYALDLDEVDLLMDKISIEINKKEEEIEKLRSKRDFIKKYHYEILQNPDLIRQLGSDEPVQIPEPPLTLLTFPVNWQKGQLDGHDVIMERERARKAERTYINSSKDTNGVHNSSNARHKTKTDAKSKDAEWKEQADTVKKAKKAIGKKAATIGLALGLIAGGAAGIYGTMEINDYLDNKELNETRDAVVQQYTEDFYENNISPYVTTTSTGDGLEYDEEGIAKSISADGVVDNYEVYGLYSNMGEAEANRVLGSVDTATVDRPFGSVEEYMRAQGQVNASNQQDVNLWKQNVADALIAQNEINSMFPASTENTATNTDQVSRGGK